MYAEGGIHLCSLHSTKLGFLATLKLKAIFVLFREKFVYRFSDTILLLELTKKNQMHATKYCTTVYERNA